MIRKSNKVKKIQVKTTSNYLHKSLAHKQLHQNKSPIHLNIIEGKIQIKKQNKKKFKESIRNNVMEIYWIPMKIF
jgi:hypothetical protein